MPNRNMLGALPYYNRHYRQPLAGLHQSMPTSEEQHTRTDAEPSEGAFGEVTDSKEDEEEDMRKHGGPNARGFPNGDMLEEQPYNNLKYEKNSEVMHPYMPLTEEESMKNNEEESEEQPEEVQAFEEGENESMRKGARRYTEDIPYFNTLEEMSPHGLNSINLRSDVVSEEKQDSKEDENTNEEVFLFSNMADELHHYKGDHGMTSQADQQNTKTMGDEKASLEGAKTAQADQHNSKTTEGEDSSKNATNSQADQQNTKTAGDEAASLANVKTFQADQQNTKTTEDRTASLESTNTSQTDQQNTKTTGDETASLESTTPSIADSSTAEATPSEVIQPETTTTEVKHIQNETESTTTTKNSRSTAQTTPSSHEKTKNIELTSTQNGTDFLNDVRGLEDRSNATVSVE
ncbi:unnamed protein product [Haemonchus placei]|uniref:Doublecortin domain-containing protein n=1 Tax=Haemonchus placei TaxID=6290 RepID=A0A0N4WDT5_HAEPC|nr:unnamed protein product [Haemonchus placei]